MNLCSTTHHEEVCYEGLRCPACEAYDDGCKEGYDTGYSEGYGNGNSDGYSEGKNDN